MATPNSYSPKTKKYDSFSWKPWSCQHKCVRHAPGTTGAVICALLRAPSQYGRRTPTHWEKRKIPKSPSKCKVRRKFHTRTVYWETVVLAYSCSWGQWQQLYCFQGYHLQIHPLNRLKRRICKSIQQSRKNLWYTEVHPRRPDVPTPGSLPKDLRMKPPLCIKGAPKTKAMTEN